MTHSRRWLAIAAAVALLIMVALTFGILGSTHGGSAGEPEPTSLID